MTLSPDEIPRATSVRRGAGRSAEDKVRLDYEGRFLRRRRLMTESGAAILVDLPETVSLNEGDALLLTDGTAIGILAAEEPLLEVRGTSLPRLAWHIGNRHTPCAIGADHLVIRDDPVLAAMLRGLGASLSATHGGFSPEGGAYGHGRTLGHHHGPAEGGAYMKDGTHSHGPDGTPKAGPHPHGG